LNKPVVVSEEAPVTPVIVPDVTSDDVAKTSAAKTSAAKTSAAKTSAAKTSAAKTSAAKTAAGPAYIVLGGISFSHFLNDTMQSLIPSVYPIFKESYALDFAQIGLITLAFQFTASLLQPVVGHFTDKKAQPFSLAVGMGSTFFGLLLLSVAHRYGVILIAAALVGLGSAVFHPESARIARLASGGRYGFAQSVFQVGGNLGTSMGPLLAALIVVPFGQPSIAWFSSIAFLAIVILWRIGYWYRPQIAARKFAAIEPHPDAPDSRRVKLALAVLVALLFSKQLYVSSLSSYYIFFLIDKFSVSTQAAQLYLFLFLAANAVGVFFGGPLGDRFGRKYVIWFSILGALPFTLALPHAGLYTSAVLTVVIGLIISSATSSIIVFAQELMPHRFGMISGVFFGVAFGIGGLGAAVLGEVADHTGIAFVYQVCAFLPAIGLLAVFLPKMPKTAH
jgi:FSR family fosmidomycin resistance protein-like MFS transporter